MQLPNQQSLDGSKIACTVSTTIFKLYVTTL